MVLAVGAKLGHYKILSPIGAGGMGEVYRARDTRLKRDVAIKILPEHLMQNLVAVERFAREARAASALNHPNIITIFDIGQYKNLHFIATELVDGETLREKIKRARLDLPSDVGVTDDREHRPLSQGVSPPQATDFPQSIRSSSRPQRHSNFCRIDLT